MLYVKGMIGFSAKRRNWISKIIRWFTRSKWSHTFVVYQTEPEVLVVEAGTFSVQLVPIKKYESRKYDTAYFDPVHAPVEQVEAGINKAREQIEKPYGWLQLIGFIPVVMFRRIFGLKISNPLKGGVICSELVLQFLRGMEPTARWVVMDKNAVSPEDLFSELSLHSMFKLSDAS